MYASRRPLAVTPARSSSTATSARVRCRALQRSREHRLAGGEESAVELGSSVIERVQRVHAWCAECQQPPEVAGGHEVPRGAQDVRPQDGAVRERLVDGGVVEAGRPLRHRPLGHGEFLSLHGDEPSDHLGGRAEPRSPQSLVAHPPLGDAAFRRRRRHRSAPLGDAQRLVLVRNLRIERNANTTVIPMIHTIESHTSLPGSRPL